MRQETSIIRRAFDLARTVEVFMAHARHYYYEVMLSGHACPLCTGPVSMIGESHCRCLSCSETFDPTLAFECCSACGGAARLRIRKYQCRSCGRNVPSRFVFDGLVFDREYFRQRVAESRERKRQQRDRTCAMIAVNQSEAVTPPAVDLESVPGLTEALDGLVAAPEMAAWLPLAKGFDLTRYQAHLEAYIGPIEMYFDDLPPLDDNTRLDRIWRFIAIIFMAHAGQIEITRETGAIVVMKKHETDREGP